MTGKTGYAEGRREWVIPAQGFATGLALFLFNGRTCRTRDHDPNAITLLVLGVLKNPFPGCTGVQKALLLPV